MKNYRKTDHFLQRQWERCIDDYDLNKIRDKIKINIKEQTHLFFGEKLLKNAKIKKNNHPNLVIVVQKKNVLVTIFFIEDLLEYFQETRIGEFKLIA